MRQIAPRRIDVVTQRDENIPQILTLPGTGPGGDGSIADTQRRIGHQRRFTDDMRGSQPVAEEAGTNRGVGREGIRRQTPDGSGWVATGAGEQHSHRIGQGCDRADRGTRTRSAPALLQGDDRRQPSDLIDLRGVTLLNQTAGVGGH